MEGVWTPQTFPLATPLLCFISHAVKSKSADSQHLNVFVV